MGTIRVVDVFPDGTIGGACFTCRSAAKEGQPVVDLDHHIDFEGYALICFDCTVDAARQLGMIDADQFEGLTAERDAALLDADEANEQARVATEAFHAILAAGVAQICEPPTDAEVESESEPEPTPAPSKAKKPASKA